jgi:hypothetical protein
MPTQELLTAMVTFNESLPSGKLEAEPAPRVRALLRQDTQGQGVFMMAKAKGDAAIAAASINHSRKYINLLFQPAMHKRKETS